MKYIDVYRMIKQAADEFSLGTFDFEPDPGTYGQQLNQRWFADRGAKARTTPYRPSTGLPGENRTDTREQRAANIADIRQQTAKFMTPAITKNFYGLATPQDSWVTKQLIEGGKRNADSWMQTGKIAPRVGSEQFKGQPEFDSMTPEQQQYFINTFNSMASTKKHNNGTNIG